MARHTKPEYQLAYAASQRFILALQDRDSILTPGQSIWTPDVLPEFITRFIDNPQEGKRKFLEKYKVQLTGAPASVVQLAAELLYVHLIANYAMKGESKRRDVREVLSWSPTPIRDVSSDALRELDGRLVFDQALNMQHPYCIAYLARFAQAWLGAPDEQRATLLRDPWAFKTFAYAIEARLAQPQREILLNMVHPETFEKVSSRGAKERIAETFDPGGSEPDMDRRLLAIRRRMTPELHENFEFWDKGVLERWRGDSDWRDLMNLTGWDAMTGWINLLARSVDFEPMERAYKIGIADRLRAARDAVRAGRGDWSALLRTALTKDNNLIDFRVRDNLFGWMSDDSAECLAALQELWREGVGRESRARAFLDHVPSDILENSGRRVQVVSVLLMADGVTDPPIKVRAFEQAYELVGHAKGPSEPVGRYLYALTFLDEILKRCAAAGGSLRDRLDAQSALWMLMHWTEKPSDWADERWQALLAFRGSEATDAEEPQPSIEPAAAKSLDAVASRLHLPLSFLQEVQTLLEDKRQVIFYGPPGTGKTYVALELAAALTTDENDVLLVQFHPSYAYEDFVEGYRPHRDNGQMGFDVRPGPLKKLADAARADPNGRYVMVIDEINRGNLARVFGELFFLLEYRDRAVSLQYSPDKMFSLPKNLWIIGTMNTADRSIALIDAALRRRFAFVPFFPDAEPVRGLLARWLEARPGLSSVAWIADVVDLANERLAARPEVGRHLQIGPSHFMREDLTAASIDRIWTYSIKPYLEEQFFGREAALADFDLASLKAEIMGARGEPA